MTIPSAALALAASAFFAHVLAGDEIEPPRADAALQAWAAHAQHITPTVTKEMGDVGGKLFGRAPDPAKTRHYYIAAEVDAWDFAPEKLDAVCSAPLSPQLVAQHTAMKVRYFEYTDATFTAKVIETPRLGILGPVLRGVVGENLAVTFLNRTSYPLSMHPHGVRYDKDNEGALYQPSPGLGAAIGAGAKFTYVWNLDESSGPRADEPSSKCWLYHSHVCGDEEANLGLVGFIVVTDPARARPDGTPNDVDREMASLFMIFSESGFSEADEEAAETGDSTIAAKSFSERKEEHERGLRYAINGCIYGNLRGLEVNQGERVRWYLFGLGDENDMHTAHWHGLRVIEENRRRTDVVELLPATMKVADMVADNPGAWLFHCHVAEHMQGGMFSQVIVHPPGESSVDRAPESAFFGLRTSERSILLDRAEAWLDQALRATEPCKIELHGRVTVESAFSIFDVPMRIQLGGKSVTFKLARDGSDTREGAAFHVLNGGRYGVVYGGTMEWKAAFADGEWLRELEKIDGFGKGATELSVPFQMDIGGAKHATSSVLAIHRK